MTYIRIITGRVILLVDLRLWVFESIYCAYNLCILSSVIKNNDVVHSFLLFVIRSLFESDCRICKLFFFHNKNVILSSIYIYIILTSHGLPICFCWDGFHTVLGQRFFSISASQRVRFYCEFRPSSGHVIKLLPGSKLYLADQCLDCSCTTDGLQCCG